MSSAKTICELFGVKEEFIYDDFACALSVMTKLPFHGRLFCLENYLCFYGSIVGIEKKEVIALKDILEINKKVSLGFIQNSIEIIAKNNKVYNFTGIANRDGAFDLLDAIWKGETIRKGQGHVEEVEKGDEGGEIQILNLEKNEDKIETLKVILPISLDKYFDLFISDKAAYPPEALYNDLGYLDISGSKWELNPELGLNMRDIKLVVKVADVPFKDRARSQKTLSYKKTSTEVTVNMTTKTFDIPYSGNFQVEETWQAMAVENSPEKIKLTISFKIVFFKSCMFETKIRTKTAEAVGRDHDRWFSIIKEKKFLPEPPRKALSDFETEKASEVDLKKSEAEIDNTVSELVRPSISGGVSKKTQEKIDLELKSFRKVVKVVIVTLAITLLLFFFTFLFMNRKINQLESRVSELSMINELLKTAKFSMEAHTDVPSSREL